MPGASAPEGFAYHALAPQALQTLLHLFNEHAARQLLPCLSPQQCSDVLFTSPNVDIVPGAGDRQGRWVALLEPWVAGCEGKWG